jgi:hypothetical protein
MIDGGFGCGSGCTGKRRGAAIDTATAVIRFNDAPTGGRHAVDVGSRTTLRLQNFMYCGYHEQRSEMLLYYFAHTPVRLGSIGHSKIHADTHIH